MYRSRNVKCANCKDIFRAEYDSRKNSQQYVSCKCGKVRGYLNSNGGFVHGINDPIESLSFKEQDYVIEHYEEDFIRLSDEEQVMLSEIINDCGDIVDRNLGVYFYNRTDERYVDLKLVGVADSMEGVDISMYVRLIDDRGFGWRFGREDQGERLLEALARFHNIVSMVKSGEIDLTRPSTILGKEDLEFDDYTKIQLELYRHEFLC